MSWSIKIAGTRAALLAALPNYMLPDGVRAAIVGSISKGPDPVTNGLGANTGYLIEGYGHEGENDNWNSVGKLEVNPIPVAPEPPSLPLTATLESTVEPPPSVSGNSAGPVGLTPQTT